MAFVVYIVRSEKDGSLYVGQTGNLGRRLQEHNSPNHKTYSAKRGPWVLVHSEEHPTRSACVGRERFLKSHAGAHEKKRLIGLFEEPG